MTVTQRPCYAYNNRIVTPALAKIMPNRNITSGLTSSVTLTITAASSNSMRVTFTVSTAFGNPVQIFDTIYVPAGSVIAGGSSQNVGVYLITGYGSNGSNTLTAQKFSPGLPTTVSSAFSGTPANDISAYHNLSSFISMPHGSNQFNPSTHSRRITFPYFGRRSSPPVGFGFDLDLPFI